MSRSFPPLVVNKEDKLFSTKKEFDLLLHINKEDKLRDIKKEDKILKAKEVLLSSSTHMSHHGVHPLPFHQGTCP